MGDFDIPGNIFGVDVAKRGQLDIWLLFRLFDKHRKAHVKITRICITSKYDYN